MESTTLKFKKVTSNATAPTKGSVYAAGYDIYSATITSSNQCKDAYA